MIVLVCGGRTYDDAERVYGVLDGLGEVALLVHGGARGADRLADTWAKARGVNVAVCRADWDRLGPAAGPLRNQKMLDLYKPDLVVAFPGGRGTADMVRRARSAGVKVMEVES